MALDLRADPAVLTAALIDIRSESRDEAAIADAVEAALREQTDGFEVVRERLAADGEELELLALLFANAPTVSGELIDRGVEILRADESDIVYYQVLSPTGEYLSGERSLPRPPPEERVTSGEVKLRDAEAALEPLKAGITKMRPVVRQSVANLRVATGGTAAGVEALNDEALLAEQSSLAEQFQSKFKAGGVAAVSQGEPAEKVGDVQGYDSVRQARIRATRPSN